VGSHAAGHGPECLGSRPGLHTGLAPQVAAVPADGGNLALQSNGTRRAGRRPRRLPAALSREEVRLVFASPGGVPRLVRSRLGQAGLRLSEALRLRVKDVDFPRQEALARGGRAGSRCFQRWPGSPCRPNSMRCGGPASVTWAVGRGGRRPTRRPVSAPRPAGNGAGSGPP
jgi:integrase